MNAHNIIYFAEWDSGINAPKKLPDEATYFSQDKVDIQEQRGKYSFGIAMITTHRILWYPEPNTKKIAYGIPLMFVDTWKSGGGFIHDDYLTLYLQVEKKLSQEPLPKFISAEIDNNWKLAPVFVFPSNITFTFHNGGSSSFIQNLELAIKGKHWQQKVVQKVEVKAKGIGIAGLTGGIKDLTGNVTQEIGSFTSMDKLKESAASLVSIAEYLRGKLESEGKSTVSQEMKDVQSVMLDIGIGTPITKEAAGKEYYSQLSMQIGDFVREALEKFGGIMTFMDAYCLYNRVRGTDLISPQDFCIAAKMCRKVGAKVNVKEMESKIWIFESESFNEKLQGENILALLKEKGSASAEQIANLLNVSLMIIKEKMKNAEKAGIVCRDDSMEGLKYCENLFLKI